MAIQGNKLKKLAIKSDQGTYEFNLIEMAAKINEIIDFLNDITCVSSRRYEIVKEVKDKGTGIYIYMPNIYRPKDDLPPLARGQKIDQSHNENCPLCREVKEVNDARKWASNLHQGISCEKVMEIIEWYETRMNE